MGTRVFAAVVSIALLVATLEPVIRQPWEDSFPLSPYAMFAFKRPTELTMEYALGVTATGERRTLTPRIVGSGEVLQALTIIARAKSAGQLPELCTQIAERVASLDSYDEVTEIRIVTGTHDAVDFLVRHVTGPEISPRELQGAAMKRLTDWWFAPAPPERLAAVRMLVGAFALLWVGGRFGETYAVAQLGRSHWKPIGVTRILDAPVPAALALAIAIATFVLLIAFTLGVKYRYTAPLAALGLLWTLTYRNSFGMVFHTENLLVMHVIALACAPAADAWAIDRRPTRPPEAGYGWVLKLLAAIVAATYLLAGIAKLRIAGVAWLDGEQLRNQIAVDNLRKALLGDSIAPLATPFLDHPSGFTVFSVMTIVLELSAPLVLVHLRVARLWALAAWGFHVGVVLLMNIWFPYPLLGLAYLPLLRAERPFAWLIGWWRRRRARGNVAPTTAG